MLVAGRGAALSWHAQSTAVVNLCCGHLVAIRGPYRSRLASLFPRPRVPRWRA